MGEERDTEQRATRSEAQGMKKRGEKASGYCVRSRKIYRDARGANDVVEGLGQPKVSIDCGGVGAAQPVGQPR